MSGREQLERMAREPNIYILLDDLNRRMHQLTEVVKGMSEELAQFRSDWNSTIPKGDVEPIELSITDEMTWVNRKMYPTMPWISFNLFNDGPDSVYVIVGPRVKKAPLASGESLTVDMKAPKIKEVFLLCDPGNTASIRIYAKR